MNDQHKGRKTPAAPQAEKDEDAAFRELLGAPLERMDAAFEPEVPQQAWFDGLVEHRRKEQRRRLARDLILLWIAGCAILGGMALLAVESVAGFVLLQGLAAAGGVITLLGGALRRGRRSWTE